MESQFRQPKQVITIEVNKQSIACNFGSDDNEVCYAKAIFEVRTETSRNCNMLR